MHVPNYAQMKKKLQLFLNLQSKKPNVERVRRETGFTIAHKTSQN